MKGAKKGIQDGVTSAPASLWNSVSGIGQLLWAGIKNPIDVPEKMIDATTAVLEYLSNQDLSTIAKDMAPELHELVTQWDSLDYKVRGKKAGFVLGKYGVDIALWYGAAKSVQICSELKQANSLCNLKSLASSEKRQAALIESAQHAAVRRQEYFQSVYIHADKQGKHMRGHKNYDSTKTVFTHNDPQKLLQQRAGKGARRGQKVAGEAGYKEVVDFGEIIGEYHIAQTREVVLTQRGMIHYDRNGGAHIVPLINQK